MATAARKRTPAAEPDPLAVVGQYIEGDLVRQLGTEHERHIGLIIVEAAEVSDPISYQTVGERLKEVVQKKRQVMDFFAPMKSIANKLHATICDREREVLKPLLAFESLAKGNWDRFKRQEEQRQRDEEQRLAREAQRQEQERLQREAELLESRGDTELAAQVMEQAIATPAPVIQIPSRLPSVPGVSSRENWKGRPIGGWTPEAEARCHALVPREFMSVDWKKIDAYAKRNKASGRIPGVEIYNEGSIAVRTA